MKSSLNLYKMKKLGFGMCKKLKLGFDSSRIRAKT